MTIPVATRTLLAAGLLGLAAGAAQPAGAVTMNTLTVVDTSTTPVAPSATIGCEGGLASSACEGFIDGGAPGAPTGAGDLSDSVAFLYDLPNNSPATVASALNTLTGTTSFTRDDATRVEAADIAGCTDASCLFQTSFLWLVFKLGPDSVFVRNTTGDLLTVDFSAIPGTGSGLSNITFFGPGSIAPIPIPASLSLLLSALAGLAYLGRSRRRTA